MIRAPTLAAIHAAELSVAQARRNTGDSLRRARIALRATLARPSTLALVAGVAGLLGFWLARRRPQPRATPSSDGAAVNKTTSAAGLVLAFIVRYGMQRLPLILQQLWASRQKRATPVGPNMPKSPDTAYSAAGVLH
jgi:hypothetical protein